jgi:hypothetical protein
VLAKLSMVERQQVENTHARVPSTLIEKNDVFSKKEQFLTYQYFSIKLIIRQLISFNQIVLLITLII